MELVHFASATGNTESFRSVLYLEQHKKNGRRHLQSWTGPWAIEHYLQAEHKGRLIQSLKSYLPSRLLTGTEVLGRHYTLEDLISRMLSDLRIARREAVRRAGARRHGRTSRALCRSG